MLTKQIPASLPVPLSLFGLEGYGRALPPRMRGDEARSRRDSRALRVNSSVEGPGESSREKVYQALKSAILDMDIYSHHDEIRLDERKFAEEFGVSRTPVREAILLLAHEGFVRAAHHRGFFIARKTRAEILDEIAVWASLESMAARLACTVASDEQIRGLRIQLQDSRSELEREYLADHSQADFSFHKHIIRLSGCGFMVETTDKLFIHMRWLSSFGIDRPLHRRRCIEEHAPIVEAIERRSPEWAGRLVRDHALALAELIADRDAFPG